MLRKTHIAIGLDTSVAAVSFLLSLYLRLGENIEQARPYALTGVILFSAICAAVFYAFRLHRTVWRYTSTQDLLTVIKAVTVSILVFLPFMFMINRLEGFPRSVIGINWCVLIMLLGGMRFAYRMWREKTLSVDFLTTTTTDNTILVLLVGVNDHTELFLREATGNKNSAYTVAGILDDDKSKHGREMRSVPVLGTVDGLQDILRSLHRQDIFPQKLVFAPGYTPGEAVRHLLDIVDGLGLTLARLPRLSELKTSLEEKIEVKNVAVEDLLGRPQQALDRESMRSLIAGKRVLITGAGGTIGSELARQIGKYAPTQIALVEISEYNLYLIDQELRELYPDQEHQPYIADVRDYDYLNHIFTENTPDIVFHAAALKHVPMSEVNVSQTVLTNVAGTKNVADLCIAHQVQEMVLISTDKAVNPSSVMGTTKRVAELYIQALGQSKKAKHTHFLTVRFGNVLGSTGSVVPLFKRQLEKGGPITITHPDMMRYFMTVREAVELVIQTAVMGRDTTANGAIFVLEMGEPVYIKDLAKQMIRLAGLEEGKDVSIAYTGLRPGEKMTEELFYPDERAEATAYEGIMRAASKEAEFGKIESLVKTLCKLSKLKHREDIMALLTKVVPEYRGDDRE